jgi:hypothetical protein
MARTSTEQVSALAHCPDPRCEGHTQRQVQALRSTVEHTYVDLGGDSPGVERSQIYLHADETCPECGRLCEITDQQRVSYAPLSGKDPNGLLQYKPPELAA